MISSTGARLKVMPDGKRCVIKPGGSAGGDSEGHVRNEFEMNKFLERLGVAVPKAEIFYPALWFSELAVPFVLKTEFEEGAVPIDESDYPQLRRDFIPHALIANWDVVGMFNDNVLRRPDGRLTYVDVGGAGPYRAQGERKGGAFGPVVHELESFMEFMPEIYQGMTKQEMRESYDLYGGAEAMLAATEVFKEDSVRNTMRSRVEYLEQYLTP